VSATAYRDHLRRRLTTEPDVPVTRLLAEIRELGYSGSANLLVRYLNQGRAHAERAVPASRLSEAGPPVLRCGLAQPDTRRSQPPLELHHQSLIAGSSVAARFAEGSDPSASSRRVGID
jgi:hypothetical protein